MALENIHLFPKEIWAQISKEMDGMQRTWRGLTDYQVTTRVLNTRLQHQESDLLQNIENSELARMKDSNKIFCSSIVLLQMV